MIGIAAHSIVAFMTYFKTVWNFSMPEEPSQTVHLPHLSSE